MRMSWAWMAKPLPLRQSFFHDRGHSTIHCRKNSDCFFYVFEFWLEKQMRLPYTGTKITTLPLRQSFLHSDRGRVPIWRVFPWKVICNKRCSRYRCTVIPKGKNPPKIGFSMQVSANLYNFRFRQYSKFVKSLHDLPISQFFQSNIWRFFMFDPTVWRGGCEKAISWRIK